MDPQAPQGPQGTGQQFKNATAKFQSRGKTNLQARRVVASAAIENDLQRNKRVRKKKKVVKRGKK